MDRIGIRRSLGQRLISAAINDAIAAELKPKELAEARNPNTTGKRWTEIRNKGIGRREDAYWHGVYREAFERLPRDLRRALGERSNSGTGLGSMAIPKGRG